MQYTTDKDRHIIHMFKGDNENQFTRQNNKNIH